MEASGKPYAFVLSGGNWVQTAYLKGISPNNTDYFGYSVGASADSFVVGSPGESSSATGIDGDATNNSAINSGDAFVFQ